MSPSIYQVSDLANRRTEFIAEARLGLARLRDKDGTSLVMVPERRLESLEKLRTYFTLFLVVDRAAQARERLPIVELGANAWIRSLPADDLSEFAGELGEAITAAVADDSTSFLDEVVASWRTTARQLDDPLRRRVLLQSLISEDYVDAERPADDEPDPLACEE